MMLSGAVGSHCFADPASSGKPVLKDAVRDWTDVVAAARGSGLLRHRSDGARVCTGPTATTAALLCAAGVAQSSAWTRRARLHKRRAASTGHAAAGVEEAPAALVDVEPLLRCLLQRREGVQLIQVGACDGDFCNDESTSDDPVQGSLLSDAGLRSLLIEPHPVVFEMLRRNVYKHFGETDRISLMNVAIAAEESGDQLPFYVVSPRLADDHPRKAPHWARFQLSSLDREHVLKHHEFVGLTKEDFEEYVEEIRVPCLAPSSLLRTAQLSPQDVHVLQVDAEGYDDKIVEAFFQLPGFRPAVTVFEATHLDGHETETILSSFRNRGYSTGYVRPKWEGERVANVVVWLPTEK